MPQNAWDRRGTLGIRFISRLKHLRGAVRGDLSGFRARPFAMAALCVMGASVLIIAGCHGKAHDPAAPRIRTTAPPLVSLQDVAGERGLRFTQQHGQHRPLTIVETMGSGCAIFDFNGDGRPDIFLVSSGPDANHPDQPSGCKLFRNDGASGFTDVTAQSGLKIDGYAMGCCVGDYDNDGRPDLFVTGFGRNWLFHNEGDGHFKDVTVAAGILRRPGAWGTGCAFADLDGDGWLDLYVCNYVRYNPAIPLCPSGKVLTGCTPSYYKTQANELYMNERNGAFSERARELGAADSEGSSLGVVITDFDGDGKPDIFVANDGAPNALLHNLGGPHGHPHFKDIALEAGVAYGQDGAMRAGMGVAAADLCGSGRMDLVVTNFQHEPTSLFENRGRDSFADLSYTGGIGIAGLLRLKFGVVPVDVDGDGRQDLYIGDGHVFDNVHAFDDTGTYRQTDQLYYNVGAGRFQDISNTAGPALKQTSVSRGVAVGDLDSDGVPYLLINDSGLPARLLKITRAHPASWIGFALRGTRCNRLAIGAQVRLKWPGGEQVQEVRSGGSYLSQSDLRPLFGLGGGADASKVAAVVRWPDGALQTVPIHALNRYINVVETAAPGADA